MSKRLDLERMRRVSAIQCLLLALGLSALSMGCASVQPWDRDLLADPRMEFGAEAVRDGLDDHTYFSKEASSGGRGFGGGGCGCN